jgi:small subunit ribosomal protein S7
MRRTKPEKREIEPDIRYSNTNLQVLINHVLKQGKKSTATRLVYGAMDII